MDSVLINMLIRLTGKKLFFPFYHAVTNKYLPHVNPVYPTRSIQQFEKDIHFIKRNFQIGEPMQLVNKSIEDRPTAFFSIDDGLREGYEVIAPILKREKIKAIFFVNTDFTDNKKLFFRHKAGLLIHKIKKLESVPYHGIKTLFDLPSETKRNVITKICKTGWQYEQLLDQLAVLLEVDFENFLKETQPYMTSEELSQLIKDGFSIGSHSMNHPLFFNLSSDQIFEQIFQSLELLKEKLSIHHSLFSFPFTDYGVKKAVFDKLNEMNIISFGSAGIKDDKQSQHFQRFDMEKNNRPGSRDIMVAYCEYLLKKMIGKHVIRR